MLHADHYQSEAQPESVANDLAGMPYSRPFSSGGGFSNIYPMPSYQQAAVENYLTNHNPGYPSYAGNASFGTGLYNRAGRAYPDVSANGDNDATVTEGEFLLSM